MPSVLGQFRIGDYLLAVRPNLGPSLVSSSSLDKIVHVADEVPGVLTSLMGFECRLGHNNGQADFLFCTSRAEPDARHFTGCQVLAGNRDDIELPSLWLEHPIWQRVRNFCRQWDDAESGIAEYLDNVWFEFDMPDIDVALPLPSMFFGLTPTSDLIVTDRTPRGVTLELLASLFDRQLPDALEDNISDAFNELSGDAYVFQVGAMLARNTDVVRVCVRDPATLDVIHYLQSLGWQGETSALDALLTDLRHLVDRVDLDLDIGEKLHNKIGLECYLNYDAEAGDKLRAFCKYLVSRGLCTDDEATSLYDYNGVSRETPETPWPEYLVTSAALLGPNIRSLIFRNVHHIKLVFDEGAVQHAKAYLAIEHRWVDVPQLYEQMFGSGTS